MKVLILGATGSVGRHLVREAINRGYEVTALVRRPEKIKEYEGRVKIITGDVLDKGTVEKAVAGQDAVIYSIGIKTPGPTTIFSKSTGLLIEAMRQNGVRRLVCITGVGAGETSGHGGFLYDKIFYPLVTKRMYQDKERQEQLIRSSGLDWIIVRPTVFREGSAHEEFRAVTEVRGETLRRISRAEVAAFALGQLADDRYLHQAPFIGHSR